jgi:hypothetical protein
VYITEEQGSSRLGDPDFDVQLMKKPTSLVSGELKQLAPWRSVCCLVLRGRFTSVHLTTMAGV